MFLCIDFRLFYFVSIANYRRLYDNEIAIISVFILSILNGIYFQVIWQHIMDILAMKLV